VTRRTSTRRSSKRLRTNSPSADQKKKELRKIWQAVFDAESALEDDGMKLVKKAQPGLMGGLRRAIDHLRSARTEIGGVISEVE